MLVRVVRLRERGAKVERTALRSAPAVEGVLSLGPQRVPVEYWTPSGERTSYVARLTTPAARPIDPDLLPPLEDARVTRVRDYALVIVGLERVGVGGSAREYRQAWWCRLVDGDRVATSPPAMTGSAVPAFQF